MFTKVDFMHYKPGQEFYLWNYGRDKWNHLWSFDDVTLSKHRLRGDKKNLDEWKNHHSGTPALCFERRGDHPGSSGRAAVGVSLTSPQNDFLEPCMGFFLFPSHRESFISPLYSCFPSLSLSWSSRSPAIGASLPSSSKWAPMTPCGISVFHIRQEPWH